MTQFTDSDIKQITEHGLNIDNVTQQLTDFQHGFPYIDIKSAAVIDDGVMKIQTDEYAEFFDANADNYKIVKFVPASGAATRMFKDLFEYLTSGTHNKVSQMVIDKLPEFAFYQDLIKYLPENPTDHDIIECIVTQRGLNYGNLPKGLLKFHHDNNNGITAVAEHLAEGAQYAKSKNTVNIHFTVSPEHISGFQELLAKIIPEHEQKFNIKYNIELSTQKSQTDTIAVTPDNAPFRNSDGTLLFRPSGHGALIENLNDLDADIIFIKNIDNVCPESNRADTIRYKKALAGLAIKLQQKIFDYIRAIDNGNADINEVSTFISDNLGIKNVTPDKIRDILNRPLRVCGMVRNTGAPGGGPFWTQNSDGTIGLQIVEPGQISDENRHILHQGQYFNPVDIVCMPYKHNGTKFNLTEFIDHTTGFISEKSKNGQPLRAMERPGLWNGAMSNWNTIFIDVPSTTFTPAKVITDLLSSDHNTTA